MNAESMLSGTAVEKADNDASAGAFSVSVMKAGILYGNRLMVI
ncbi:hypothetical protein [Paenibacillus sp. LjRoot56]